MHSEEERKRRVQLTCVKCKKKFSAKNCLTCSTCKFTYDLDCAIVSSARFCLMEAKDKINWRCRQCINNKNKKTIQINDSRKKPSASKSNPTANKAPVKKLRSDCTPTQSKEINVQSTKSPKITPLENASVRQNRLINFTPINLEESLLRDDGQMSPVPSTSVMRRSLPELFDIENSSTPVMTDESVYSTKSLDLSTNKNYRFIDNLKTEIEELKSLLSSTQNELDNTILINNQLLREINKLKQEIIALKDFCTSPLSIIRKGVVSSRKKKVRRLILNTSPSLPMACLNSSLPLNKSSTEIGHTEDTNHIDETPLPSRKIHIIGGRQCRGLCMSLIKSRQNNPYETYEIRSNIKPDASTEEILSSLDISNISTHDRVILSVGEHDQNPMKIMTELSASLKRLSHCTVIILSIKKNPHLNEKKVNEMLKLISNNFQNCNFVDLSYNYVNKTLLYGKNLYEWCKKINFVIDQLDYDYKFLRFNKRQQNHGNLNSNRYVYNGGNKQKYKKGTIPYYFPIISDTKSTSIETKEQKTINSLFR